MYGLHQANPLGENNFVCVCVLLMGLSLHMFLIFWWSRALWTVWVIGPFGSMGYHRLMGPNGPRTGGAAASTTTAEQPQLSQPWIKSSRGS